ncbi:MAG: pyruvate kinase [Anaerolinea sp.]|nr:pyruvate kinase [Anaerolinea sp.]MCC6972953.1 pyruvate kinase [Anaerolineae bacterium]CAG0987545.1 pyruvate kinase [Anaerolineae bacterium]
MVRKFDVKRTKIVCTIGPSSSDEQVLREMIRVGMDVARINFSHGDHETHRRNIELVRRIAVEENAVVAIMGDLQGPKIRLGKLTNEPIPIKKGDHLTLTARKDADGTNLVLPLPHPDFLADIREGHRLLLDDGNLEFRVIARQGDDLVCEVVVGGELRSRKGVSAPESKLKISALTPKDIEDVKFALDVGVDYVAMSFVRSANDLRELRWLCKHLGKEEVALVAKIEKREAIQSFSEILEATDAVMVARGDLGVETPAEAVPIHQKEIIRQCNEAGKPVITATQMLQSMVDNPRPTRAEASDVANAIFDGTDAVMLSQETAQGEFPVQAVATMATIAVMAEKHFAQAIRPERGRWLEAALPDLFEEDLENISIATSRAASLIADLLNARLIVTASYTGMTARLIARTRPRTSILCATTNEQTSRRLAMVWGVHPMIVPQFTTIDEMIERIVVAAHSARMVEHGDTLVLVAGVPFGMAGQANFLKIHRVGESQEVPAPGMAANLTRPDQR